MRIWHFVVEELVMIYSSSTIFLFSSFHNLWICFWNSGGESLILKTFPVFVSNLHSLNALILELNLDCYSFHVQSQIFNTIYTLQATPNRCTSQFFFSGLPMPKVKATVHAYLLRFFCMLILAVYESIIKANDLVILFLLFHCSQNGSRNVITVSSTLSPDHFSGVW